MSDGIYAGLEERRMRSDRRQFGWKTFLFGFLRSRRHSARRIDDTDVLFLDWHHPWLFFLAVGTMALSVADAFFTLLLMEKGMIEANPVMASLMAHGTDTFVMAKLTMTGCGILTLVFFAKSRFLDRVRTGLILTALFSGYACLVCYEIVNLLHLM